MVHGEGQKEKRVCTMYIHNACKGVYISIDINIYCILFCVNVQPIILWGLGGKGWNKGRNIDRTSECTSRLRNVRTSTQSICSWIIALYVLFSYIYIWIPSNWLENSQTSIHSYIYIYIFNRYMLSNWRWKRARTSQLRTPNLYMYILKILTLFLSLSCKKKYLSTNDQIFDEKLYVTIILLFACVLTFLKNKYFFYNNRWWWCKKKFI